MSETKSFIRSREKILRATVTTLACASLLTGAGCAKLRQGPLGPTGPNAAPHLTDDRFISFDGARLGARQWLPADHGWTDAPQAVIAAIHGMNDYSQTYKLAGPYWAARGYAVHAYDQRGFGRSPNRGVWPEQATMLADVAWFVAALRAEYPGRPIILVGHSMGGAAALAALDSATPPDIDGLVLIAPAVWGWSQLNGLYATALRMAAGVAPGWMLTGKGLNRWPTDNIELLRELGDDPLMQRETRVDAILGLVDLMEAGWRVTPPADLPVLILLGEHDQIVPPDVIRAYAQEQAPDAEFIVYPDGWHMLERDLQREKALGDIVDFITRATAPEAAASDAVASGTKEIASR